MGGSMHIADFSVGMLGAIGIVGAGIPIAMGAGLSIKYRKTKQVSVSFFGDGASNEGSFHESINMAAVWKLPVIFVCENNFYGFSTPIKQVIPTDNIAVRAQAYNIPGVIADGMDVMEVYRVAKEAVERARQGLGPTLIECRTYRYKGHSRFEKPTYRREEEVKEWMQKDPIPKLKDYLLKNSICDENKIISIENEIEIELQESVEFAKNSPLPEDDIALKLVFKEG